MKKFTMRQWGKTGNLAYHESDVTTGSSTVVSEMELIYVPSFGRGKLTTITHEAFLQVSYIKEDSDEPSTIILPLRDVIILRDALTKAIDLENMRNGLIDQLNS